jgi:DNA-binding NtrC family response regulator
MILDLILPGMSSRAVLEEVRRIKPGLKVILTSAYAKETAIASFGGMRVDSFIRKPFHLNDIESLLHEMIAPERT